MTDTQFQSGPPQAKSAADGDATRRLAAPRPVRAWRNSLLGKTTSIFLIGVMFAYGLGALVGWQMFTTATQQQWRDQARMNIQIASAAEEQSAVAEEINRNVLSISQVGQQTSQASQQTMVASEEMARLAAQLQNVVSQFRV